METFLSLLAFALFLFGVVFAVKSWKVAVEKRDAAWAFRPLAGAFDDEKSKPSAFWYLFR